VRCAWFGFGEGEDLEVFVSDYIPDGCNVN